MFKTDGGGGATGPDRTLDCLTFWLGPAVTGDRQLELEQTQNIRDLQSKTLFAFRISDSEAYMRRVFILRSGACSGRRLGRHEKHSSALV